MGMLYPSCDRTATIVDHGTTVAPAPQLHAKPVRTGPATTIVRWDWPTGVSVLADKEIPHEHELEDRQGRLYPVGRALRRTFDADNHETLGAELTGLMLELARIDPDAPGLRRGVLPPSAPALSPEPADRPSSWWRNAVRRLLR